LSKRPFDLLVLDVMLPDMNGFELCARLRAIPAYQSVPVLFLTAKNTLEQKIMGLSLGADDYITKPFNPEELRARVMARLRHLQHQPQREAVLEFSGLRMDLAARRVFALSGQHREEIRLTKKEFNLLAFLAGKPDTLRSREQILSAVWPDDVNVTERTVDSHISKLRRKLGVHADRIESVHAEGYRFNPAAPSEIHSSRAA
jgi:DNA-binding response OmpR family regulator